MINTINSSSSWLTGAYSKNSIGYYSNLAQMNNNKLSQILSKRSGSSASKANGLSASASNFLKQYQNKMTEMMNTANSMRSMGSNGSYGEMVLSSSDSSVMEAQSYYKLSQAETYDVNVEQLAASQVNASAELTASDTASMSGQLTIATNSKTLNINLDSLSGTTNEEKLNALAKEVNRYSAGVSASVVKDNGKVSLQIKGTSTGKNNGFIVSGDFASQNGLDQVKQSAQDAKYTVDGQQKTSSSNTVDLGGYKISATLKKEGKAKITVGADPNASADKVQKLVDSFNDTLKLLNDNSEMGAGVLKQMRKMIVPPTSEKSLNMAGITIGKDGSLKFDKTTFKTAMEKSPNLINNIISGSHGLAEGIYSDARSGLNTSSASLVSSELAQTKANTMSDSLSFMGSYSKNGAYNMLNYYAVSSMMNFYI